MNLAVAEQEPGCRGTALVFIYQYRTTSEPARGAFRKGGPLMVEAGVAQLRPVGAGVFGCYAGGGTGLCPDAAFVAGSVVGKGPLGGDTYLEVPGMGPLPEPGCGGCCFVVKDFGAHESVITITFTAVWLSFDIKVS